MVQPMPPPARWFILRYWTNGPVHMLKYDDMMAAVIAAKPHHGHYQIIEMPARQIMRGKNHGHILPASYDIGPDPVTDRLGDILNYAMPDEFLRRQRAEPANILYVIDSGLTITKIGITASPRKRLRHIQSHSPVPLAMVFAARFTIPEQAMTCEGLLHRHFQPWHSHDEWFRVSPATAIAAVEKLSADHNFVYTPEPL